MKPFLVVVLGLAAALSSATARAALDVFACEPEWAALAKELGGDKVSVFQAVTAQQDVHRVEARPSLMARARSADLLVCTGAELEITTWSGEINVDVPNARIINSSRREREIRIGGGGPRVELSTFSGVVRVTEQ